MNDEIVFRSFQPQDVLGVNRLFVEEYGESYPYKVESESERENYSFVAVLSGDIVGFARSAWLNSDDYPGVQILGGCIVAEKCRRRGIGDTLVSMRETATSEAKDIFVLHSEPVCWGNGLASQKNLQKHGFRILGLCPVKYPSISPEWHGDQPASMTIVARPREDDAIGSFAQYWRYLPSDYEGLVEQLMHHCPWAPRSEDDQARIMSRFPVRSVIRHHSFSEGDVQGSTFVDVPVNYPWALGVIESLRREGYLFSAFLPEHGGYRDRSRNYYWRFDYLRLYRPPSRLKINWDLIGVIQEAENVKRFCVEEYTRRSSPANTNTNTNTKGFCCL